MVNIFTCNVLWKTLINFILKIILQKLLCQFDAVLTINNSYFPPKLDPSSKAKVLKMKTRSKNINDYHFLLVKEIKIKNI